MRQQYNALLLIVLVLGSNAANINERGIQSELQDKNSQFYQFLEEGSQYVVDEVLNLLKNLEDAARTDLSNLIKAWQKEKAILTDIVKKSTLSFQSQRAECNRQEAQQHVYEQNIQLRQEEVARNNAQTQANTQRIAILKNERCNQNELYVDHVIDHRDALLLFNVLLKAVDSYKAGSFVEINSIENASETLQDYINTYAKQHYEEFSTSMIQLNNSLRNKFISKKQQKELYTDNTKKQITLKVLDQNTVRTLANIKVKLTKILNTLISNEAKARDEQTFEEANASQVFATIKSALQDESRKNKRRNEVLAVQIAGFNVLLAKQIILVQTCRKQQDRLQSSMQLAQKNFNSAQVRYRARKVIVLGFIALFSKLYVFYKERVYNVATKADRERIQDYVENKNFKASSSYTSKKAAKFQVLNGGIKKFARTNAQLVLEKDN